MKQGLFIGGYGMLAKTLNKLKADDEIYWDIPYNFRFKSAQDFADKVSGYDIVVNAAGKVGGIKYNIQNKTLLEDNLAIAINGYQGAYVADTPYIYIGSSCAYSPDVPQPFSESSIMEGGFEPTNLGYGLAKRAGIGLCLNAPSHFSCLALVSCNLYGEFDNYDSTYGHLIGSMITKMKTLRDMGQKAYTIWGNGEQRREFMNATYLCNAINYFAKLMLEENSCIGKVERVINIGPEVDYSVLEYAKAIASGLNWEPQWIFDTNQPIGMQSKCMSSSLARTLGWWATDFGDATILEDVAQVAATFDRGY